MVDLSKIDTQEKAYLLGILGADGCMKQRGKYYCLSFGLTYSDREHVQRVASLISDRIKVHDYFYPSNRKPMTYFEIGDSKLCLDLISHGIVPRKSKILKPPSSIPSGLTRHYIRGYFDGDGSVFNTTRDGARVYANCVGTKEILEFINQNFQIFYDNNTSVTQSGQGELCHLKFSGKTAIAFLNYIYQDATIYLERKYDKSKHFLVPKESFSSYIRGLEKNDVWLKEEEDFLTNNTGTMNWKEVSLVLGRSHKAVTEKAHRLGLISYGRLSEEEVYYLMKHYTKRDRSEVARFLGKSLRSILQEVRLLKKESRWTELCRTRGVL